MKSIPLLAEEDIRHFIGEQSFLKGLQYFQHGAILHPVRQGMTLKAYCCGLGSRLALKAAEQAEETQPSASLDLYQ